MKLKKSVFMMCLLEVSIKCHKILCEVSLFLVVYKGPNKQHIYLKSLIISYHSV